jgi:hypothetical protein
MALSAGERAVPDKKHGGLFMSTGYASASPSGFQSVSGFPMGYGGGMGFGSGFGLDALLILLLLGGNNGGFLNRGAAAGAVTTDVLLQPAFQSLQHQVGALGEQFNQTQVVEAINNGCSGVTNQVNNGSREVVQGIGAIRTDLANGNFNTLNSINGLGRDITAQNTQSLIQSINQSQGTNGMISNGFNNTNLALLTGFNGIGMQFADTRQQLSNCCCEIKSTIRDSQDTTLQQAQQIKDLINGNRLQDLQSQVTALTNSLSNSGQTNQIIAAMQANTAAMIAHMSNECSHGRNGGSARYKAKLDPTDN